MNVTHCSLRSLLRYVAGKSRPTICLTGPHSSSEHVWRHAQRHDRSRRDRRTLWGSHVREFRHELAVSSDLKQFDAELSRSPQIGALAAMMSTAGNICVLTTTTHYVVARAQPGLCAC